jgi:sigma-B regulation protein RsbU (phosphoserine phosphatase)
MNFNPRTRTASIGESGACEIPHSGISFKVSAEETLRQLIREAADQLCQVVDGDLDFVVRVAHADDDVDKFLLLVNFVLASARRSFDGLREANQRLEADLAAARNLQEKLMPQTLEQLPNLQISAKFVPARAVGGDFFDFLRYHRCGQYAGILADVSGKGSPAAIYAGLASGFARSLVQEELRPSEMLRKLNENLFRRAPDGQFVALTFFTWDDINLVLDICNAGLPEPLLFRNGTMHSLAIHGLPLGLFPEVAYEVKRVECEPGDTIVFYTDGLTDALDANGIEFGTERLADIVVRSTNLESSELVDRLVQAVREHCRCEVNLDDQTIIVMKIL